MHLDVSVQFRINYVFCFSYDIYKLCWVSQFAYHSYQYLKLYICLIIHNKKIDDQQSHLEHVTRIGLYFSYFWKNHWHFVPLNVWSMVFDSYLQWLHCFFHYHIRRIASMIFSRNNYSLMKPLKLLRHKIKFGYSENSR